jgi:phosphomannomutase
MTHHFNPTILRQYDVRGIVGKTLEEADAHALGRSFATMLQQKGGKTVSVGYDGRLHSPRLASALIKGLRESGANVTLIGLCPTPQLYFSTYHLGVDAGVMITGSHNPPDYNGFKMMLKAKPFYGAAIQELGAIAATGDYAVGAGSYQEQSVDEEYVARVLKDINFGSKHLKVAWDAGNGAMGNAMVAATKRMAGEHFLLNEIIDGTFPAHHPDPTVAENLVQLIDVVKKNNCDVGIAFDGDGDRIGVVDGEGGILWGDQLLTIWAEAILEKQSNATIIADVKASQVFFDEVKRMGGNPLMWQTGHSLIKAKMAETKAPLAGEMSGHIFFADRYYGFDDALYAAIRLLEILSHKNISLTQIRKDLPHFINTPELRFACDEDKKFGIVKKLQQVLAAENANMSTIDGVRVNTAHGWWLLRASNTQAVLVARCESQTEDGLAYLQNQLQEYLAKVGVKSIEITH